MHAPEDVERQLSEYYEQEALDRRDRQLDAQRVRARNVFVASQPASRRVLEIGIGPGRDAAGFVAAGHTVIGIDLAQAHAELADAAGAHASVATARALPFADASFDVVWTMSTLMHIPETAIGDVLLELARVLRVNGTAVIGVWGGADAEDVLTNTNYGPRLFSRRSSERWRAMLSMIGTVEVFEEWHQPDEDRFWYQYAVVGRS